MIDTRKSASESIFKRPITRQEAIDTGMAMVLVCLIGGLYTGNKTWFMVATGALLVNMTVPALFKPLARLWLGFSQVLGGIMSKIILSIIFFGLLTPLALLRRVFGHDPMALKAWKKEGTAFVTRDHTFTPKDIEQPF